MSRFEIDTGALRRPLTLLCLTLGVIGLLLWASGEYRDRQQTALQRARADLNVLRAEYRQAVEAGGILQTSRRRYEQLRLRGFVGEEPRLQWIESLRNSGRDVELHGLKYTLRQRRSVRLDGHSGDRYQLYGSPVQLHLELAHEGRLVDFLTALDEERAAVYQLRACTMEPGFTGGEPALDKPNVSADCDMIWYTVDQPEQMAEDPI